MINVNKVATRPRRVKDRSKANMGKSLELSMISSSRMYAARDQADVYRQHPEVRVKRGSKGIVGANFQSKAGLDFIGIRNGVPFTFDAKETASEDRFPLSNVAEHQLETMARFTKHGGYAFLVVSYKLPKVGKTFLLSYEKLKKYTDDTGKKSIPLSYFEEHAVLIEPGGNLNLDYLTAMQREWEVFV